MTLFASLGYDGTNFRQITELCGAARPLILYHYKSKEELWRKVVERIMQRFNAALAENLQKAQPTSDEARARHSMGAFLDALVAVPEYGQLLLREGVVPGPRLDWITQQTEPAPTMHFRYQDPELNRRVKRTILRDVLTATLLSIVTLGPLLDAALAAALHKRNAGVYPLTKAKRDELIELMIKLIFMP
jgi:AcrR family transcriptional regulator